MSETKEQSQQLSLKYEDITGIIAGRPTIRKDDRFKDANIISYTVPLNEIGPRPGYNPRKKFKDIPELAESLLEDGQHEAMKVVVLKDGRILFYEGDRRYRAFSLLLEQGRIKPDHRIIVTPAKYDTTEEELLKETLVSNSNYFKHTFLPIENSDIAFRFKYSFTKEPRTDEEVSKIMRCSRQTVTNLITIAEASDDIKNQLLEESMTMSDALEYIRKQRKGKKEADKKEEESHVTSASAASLPQDPLKQEMEELSELDKQAEEMKEQNQEETEEARANRERVERAQLLEVANEVYVSDVELVKHIGKRLAASAVKTTEEDFVDEDNGEVVPVEVSKIIFEKGTLVDEDTIKTLIEEGVKVCFINKEVTVAPSVITEPVAEKEKNKYDSDRPEIAQVQNAIQLNDRAAVRVEKLEIAEGDKKDLLDWLKWQMNDLMEVREWVHSNKKQNKIR